MVYHLDAGAELEHGAQRCALEWFSKAWFGHKILKKIGSFAGDARLFHGCQQTIGIMGILFGYVWVDCLHG